MTRKYNASGHGYRWREGIKTHAYVCNMSPNLICTAKQRRARNSYMHTQPYISEIKYHMLYNMCPQKIKERKRAKESTREMDEVCTVKIVLWMEKP